MQRTDPPMQPLYFGSPQRPVFGCWHAPSAEVALDTAVLLCAPFGREEASAHRALRRLAVRLAAAGCGVLRFDYPGTGDSAGDEFDADLVDAWCATVHAGLDELKRLSGASRLAVFGLRLGALLGAWAAAQRSDVAAFVALAPVTAGRAFVREQKVLQAASAIPGLAPPEADWLEAGGFVMTAATRNALSALDLRKTGTPAPRVLVIDRDDMPPSKAWLEHLRASGAAVDPRQLPGYANMMQDPHNTVLPGAALDAAVQWLSAGSAPRAGALPQVPLRSQAQLGAVIEQPVTLDTPGARLNAVSCTPASDTAPRRAVLLVNAGAQRRIGPSRLYVALSRRWAAQGLLVLRLDLSGLGDSPAAAGKPDNIVYSPSAVDEVTAAAHRVRALWPAVGHCTALGICSGAYHGLKAAVQGAPLDAVVAVNPLTFFWHEGTPLDAPTAAHVVASEMQRYRSNLLDWQRWRKLLRGDVDLLRLGGLLWRRALQAATGPLRDMARLLRLPLKEDLARELRQLSRGAVALHFVFAAGEPGEQLLRTQAGVEVSRQQRKGALTIDHVDDADHTFTGHRAREQVTACLGRRVLVEAASAPQVDSGATAQAARPV